MYHVFQDVLKDPLVRWVRPRLLRGSADAKLKAVPSVQGRLWYCLYLRAHLLANVLLERHWRRLMG